jgi:CubicO group peptidase (beta-lactamase class C family)
VRVTWTLSLIALIAGGPVRAQSSRDSSVSRVLAYLEAAAEEHRREEDTPGIVIAAVTRDSLLGIRAVGVADLGTRAPMPADGRFLAGSISKAFTAVALLQLQEEGAVDVHRPLANYLPWFRMRSAGGPITVEQLLTHTAGLPRDRSDLPSSPYTALALRDRGSGVPPGERFAYSNLGYQLLSLMIEEVEGRPFTEIIQSRVLTPLALRATEPAVTQGARLRAVTGYQYLWDDRPPIPGEPLVPVPWNEYSAGDANLVTTAPDLAVFLRMLLAQGRGPSGRLLQPVSFGRMVQRTVPAPELGPGMFYGYGVVLGSLEGDPILWHSGGMLGYRSMIAGDLDEGLGVVVLMNGPGNPRRLAEYALRVLIAARRNRPLPPVPVTDPPERIPDADSFAGSFADSAGEQITLEAAGGGLDLLAGGARIPLLAAGPAKFVARDSIWGRFPLRVLREGGLATEVLHGGRWFVSDRYRGPREFPSPAAWSRLVGHYRAQLSYYSNYRVVVRKGELLLISPEGIEEPLVPRGGTDFAVGRGEHPVEQIHFADVVSGRALRMNLSGTDYYRTTTP